MINYQALVISSLILWVCMFINLGATLTLIKRVKYLGSAPSFSNLLADISPPLERGAHAPGFVAETLEGSEIELADYSGTKVAFVFVTLDCPPCLDVIPELAASAAGALRAGVELALVVSGSRGDALRYLNDNSISMSILIAPKEENSFFKDYRADATPFYCVVDEEGKVEETGIFTLEMNPWRDRIREWKEATTHKAVAEPGA